MLNELNSPDLPTPPFALTPAEEALAQSVAGLEDPVVITRANLAVPGPTIIAVSPGMTALTQYNAAEMVGRNPRFLQGPLSDRAVLQRLREACEQGQHFHGETVNYRKDGSSYILQWTVDPIRDKAGQITHFFALQRDVTAQRPFAQEWLVAEERARAAHAALSAHMLAIAEAILVLEQTKRSFQSKQLGELRQRLVQLSRARGSG
jgi:PAS domain S-box-containing protein